jgi:predicted phosphodiesterase
MPSAELHRKVPGADVRWGVMADVHANLPALRAVLSAGRRTGVDGWILAGDLVGYGPFPDECVEEVAELDAVWVAGNHELLVLDRLEAPRSGRLARETTEWTRAALSPASRSMLGSLPTVARVDDVVVAHGALDDPERYVATSDQARRELAIVADRWSDVVALVLGHTHRPMVLGARGPVGGGEQRSWATGDEPLVLNPGSVGQSRQREREPKARFAVLDTEARQVTLCAVHYDVEATRAALRRHGLPDTCIHVHPGPGRTLVRWARRSVSQASRTST